MDDTVQDFIGELNGQVATTSVSYEPVKGLSTVLPNDEDIIYEAQPHKTLDYQCVDKFVFKVIHKVDGIIRSHCGAHSCASHL